MHAAAQACHTEELIGRRASTRHRLDLAARLIAPHANLRVQLEDISVTGACIRLMHPQPLASGRLNWLQFSVFARVVWQKDLRCGMMFDEPLAEESLRQTLEFAELSVKDASEKYLRLASAWVHGPGDY